MTYALCSYTRIGYSELYALDMYINFESSLNNNLTEFKFEN